MSLVSSLCRRTPVALLALALLSACNGDARTPAAPSPSPLPGPQQSKSVEIDISKADLVLMVRTPSAPVGERGGTSQQLDAGIFSKKGKTYPNKNERFFEWVSSDPSVATVDTAGLVSAVGVGTAYVIVDYKGEADSVPVAVIPVPVKTVTVTGPDSLSLDDTASYIAATLDSVGEPLIGRLVRWTSSSPTSLAVDAGSGVGVALATGTAVVTAESEEGTKGSTTTKVWLQPVATITVAPSSASVALYRGAPTFSATLLDRRGKVLTGRVLTWRSSDPAVFTIDALTGAATTLAPGAADAIAESEGKSGSGRLTVTNPVEARALWVTRFDYTSATGVRTIIQKAKAARFNLVYFQVRGTGDAFYRSTLEPCARAVCGTLGGATMSYDPLATAIAEAGADIEVHAYVNAFTAWASGSTTTCSTLIPSATMHYALANPTHILTSSTGVVTPCATTPEYIWFSPGVPQVRTHLARIAADILRSYPGVKGIHLDRIRYPSTAFSYDAPSVNAYRAVYGPTAPLSGVNWANFRRGFVNAAVKEVYDTIQAVRPSAVLSAAVWPIYKQNPKWGGTSKGYDDYFQDPRAWTSGGYLDVAAPMLYPATTGSTSYTVKPNLCDFVDWECLFDEHRLVIEGDHKRHVYAGIGAIKGWAEMDKQLAIARRDGAIGISVYSYGTMQANSPTAWANLANGYFKYPATIPAMPWKP